jgi:bifunctional UDP-N-acetylglucosamine pyrophosphorylase/glucosamine-1-phosphate N-acetyltransferase
MSFQAVVLAAGKGTRMRSETIKVLHEVLGRTLIDRVVDTAIEAGAERVTVVLGHDREKVEAHLSAREDADRLATAVQAEQLGTGHAVWEAREQLRDQGTSTLVLYGDVPNLSVESIQAFIAEADNHPGKLSVMTSVLSDPARYGRMLRDDEGNLTGIVEYKDADEAQRAIREINTGIMLVDTDFLLAELEKLCSTPSTNAQGEFYLTDLVEVAANGGGAHGWILPDAGEMQGVNNRQDLAAASTFLRRRINARWMQEGVTMIDPETTYIESTVILEPDVILGPNVHLRGETRVARDAHIDTGCVLTNSSVGQGSHLLPHSVVTDSAIASNSAIGPFAHLRPGSKVGNNCKVGNFVELKKSTLEDGAKAGHLSYIGDARVGARANIGAGTITCNYDGKNKHHTDIGEDVFIGSNSALVAPVKIEDEAYVAAGSTITNTIPSGALGVARGRQKNIEGWVSRKGHNK